MAPPKFPAAEPESAETTKEAETEFDNEAQEDIVLILSAEPKSAAETDAMNTARDISPSGEVLINEKHVRFLQTLSGEAEAAIPPAERETIEKPGIILEKSPFDKTADLQQLPTVISADQKLLESREAEKTRLAAPIGAAPAPPPEPEFDSDQLVLSDFEEPLVPEQISEEELEAQLLKKKREKVKSFRLTAEHLAAAERESILDEMQADPFELEDTESEAARQNARRASRIQKKRTAAHRIPRTRAGTVSAAFFAASRKACRTARRCVWVGSGLFIFGSIAAPRVGGTFF